MTGRSVLALLAPHEDRRRGSHGLPRKFRWPSYQWPVKSFLKENGGAWGGQQINQSRDIPGYCRVVWSSMVQLNAAKRYVVCCHLPFFLSHICIRCAHTHTHIYIYNIYIHVIIRIYNLYCLITLFLHVRFFVFYFVVWRLWWVSKRLCPHMCMTWQGYTVNVRRYTQFLYIHIFLRKYSLSACGDHYRLWQEFGLLTGKYQLLPVMRIIICRHVGACKRETVHKCMQAKSSEPAWFMYDGKGMKTSKYQKVS